MSSSPVTNPSSPSTSIFSNKWMVILCALIATTPWGSAFPMVKLGYALLQIGQEDLWDKILYAGYRVLAASSSPAPSSS